jgi:hypothetical protein
VGFCNPSVGNVRRMEFTFTIACLGGCWGQTFETQPEKRGERGEEKISRERRGKKSLYSSLAVQLESRARIVRNYSTQCVKQKGE